MYYIYFEVCIFSIDLMPWFMMEMECDRTVNLLFTIVDSFNQWICEWGSEFLIFRIIGGLDIAVICNTDIELEIGVAWFDIF